MDTLDPEAPDGDACDIDLLDSDARDPPDDPFLDESCTTSFVSVLDRSFSCMDDLPLVEGVARLVLPS